MGFIAGGNGQYDSKIMGAHEGQMLFNWLKNKSVTLQDCLDLELSKLTYRHSSLRAQEISALESLA